MRHLTPVTTVVLVLLAAVPAPAQPAARVPSFDSLLEQPVKGSQP